MPWGCYEAAKGAKAPKGRKEVGAKVEGRRRIVSPSLPSALVKGSDGETMRGRRGGCPRSHEHDFIGCSDSHCDWYIFWGHSTPFCASGLRSVSPGSAPSGWPTQP